MIFGSLTVLFTLLPAIMYAFVSACLRKGYATVWKNFFQQLPILNIWKNYQTVQEIKEKERIIEFYSKRASMTKKKKLREKFEAIAWAYSQELDQMKSKHQIFKGYQAVFESGLQFILQLTIAFGKHGSLYEIELWVWLTTSMSFFSMASTFTSLYVELPFQVGDKVHAPLRSLPQMLKILVLMTLSLGCRLYPIVLILIVFKWEAIVIALPLYLIFLLIVSILALLRVMFCGRKHPLKSSMIDQAILALFTSALQPCVQITYVGDTLHHNGKNYMRLCYEMYLVVLFILYPLAFLPFEFFKDKFNGWILLCCYFTVFIQIFLGKRMTSISSTSNNVFAIQHATDTNDIYYFHDTIRIPILNIGSRGINDIIPENGLQPLSYLASQKWFEGIKGLLTPFNAEDTVDPEMKKRCFSCIGINLRMWSHKSQSIFLCLKKPHTDRKLDCNLTGSIMNQRNHQKIMSIAELEQTARKLHATSGTAKAIDVMNQAKNLWNEMVESDPYYSKTAIMITSELKDIESLKVFMEHGKENGIEFNIQDHKGRSAFIHACQETGDLEAREDTVRIFLQNAEELQINLHLKDDAGKNGFQYLPEELKAQFETNYPRFFENQ